MIGIYCRRANWIEKKLRLTRFHTSDSRRQNIPKQPAETAQQYQHARLSLSDPYKKADLLGMSSPEAKLLAAAKEYLHAVSQRNRSGMLSLVVPDGSITTTTNRFVPESLQNMIANINFEATTQDILERFSDEAEPVVTVRGEAGKQIGSIISVTELWIGANLYMKGDVITSWVCKEDKWFLTAQVENLSTPE